MYEKSTPISASTCSISEELEVYAAFCPECGLQGSAASGPWSWSGSLQQMLPYHLDSSANKYKLSAAIHKTEHKTFQGHSNAT